MIVASMSFFDDDFLLRNGLGAVRPSVVHLDLGPDNVSLNLIGVLLHVNNVLVEPRPVSSLALAAAGVLGPSAASMLRLLAMMRVPATSPSSAMLLDVGLHDGLSVVLASVVHLDLGPDDVTGDGVGVLLGGDLLAKLVAVAVTVTVTVAMTVAMTMIVTGTPPGTSSLAVFVDWDVEVDWESSGVG